MRLGRWIARRWNPILLFLVVTAYLSLMFYAWQFDREVRHPRSLQPTICAGSNCIGPVP